MFNLTKRFAVLTMLALLCSNLHALYNEIDKGIQLFEAGELEQAKKALKKLK
ncbi:MAG: hypothetical protein ACE5I1_03705 [bacterium]